VTGVWVKEQQLHVKGDAISEFQVNLLVTFVLDE
jgi:hypothetical protein